MVMLISLSLLMDCPGIHLKEVTNTMNNQLLKILIQNKDQALVWVSLTSMVTTLELIIQMLNSVARLDLPRVELITLVNAKLSAL